VSAPADAPPAPTAGQQTIDGGEIREPDNGQVVFVEEIRVDGTTQLGLIDFGGKQPQSATIRLQGGEYELLEGRAFRKGDVVHFTGTAIVLEVGARDKIDGKTGIVVSAKQRHAARITDLVVTGAE
jgi:hypothetical protein